MTTMVAPEVILNDIATIIASLRETRVQSGIEPLRGAEATITISDIKCALVCKMAMSRHTFDEDPRLADLCHYSLLWRILGDVRELNRHIVDAIATMGKTREAKA